MLFYKASSGQGINPETDIVLSKVQYNDLKAKADRLPAMGALVKKWGVNYDSLNRKFEWYKSESSSLLSDQIEINKALRFTNDNLKDQIILLKEALYKMNEKYKIKQAEDAKTINNYRKSVNYYRDSLNKCKKRRADKKEKVNINGKNSSIDIIQ